jgi:hypothetical protein
LSYNVSHFFLINKIFFNQVYLSSSKNKITNSSLHNFSLSFSFLALSINQPKFCPTASWKPNGITFYNSSRSTSGFSKDYCLFVNINNTIYVVNEVNSTILVWHENSTNPTNIIPGKFGTPFSLFVTLNGDIYIDDGQDNSRVQKWIAKTNSFVTVMKVNVPCRGLFVDTNDTLYCSVTGRDKVVKRSLNDPEITSAIDVAGTGFKGSASYELNSPWGIFVDVNLDLYVADSRNNRVQLFRSGELNGTTVAGSRSQNPTINLLRPTAIVLDAEKYLFIVDTSNHRIVGSGLNGFRCLVGCEGRGSLSNQLSLPSSFSFDRSGNIYVADLENNRIQKFEYLEKSCGMSK